MVMLFADALTRSRAWAFVKEVIAHSTPLILVNSREMQFSPADLYRILKKSDMADFAKQGNLERNAVALGLAERANRYLYCSE